MVSHVASLKNYLDFRYRNFLRIRWKIREFKKQSHENLYLDGRVSQKALLYGEKYNLDNLLNRSTSTVYKINLYFLNLLERYLSDHMGSFAGRSVRVLDTGSDDWHYVSSLWSFLDVWSQRKDFHFSLKGVELDAYRMYENLHTRVDYAEAYMRGLKNTEYMHGNVLDVAGEYELIFSFLPFVTKREAAGWKLSLRFYDPVSYFEHLYNCLRQDGLLLVVNVNEYEGSILKNILRKIRVEPLVPPERFRSPFFSYRTDRYATVIKKG